ncbi:T-cell-specific surface glycoprotein CD28 [Brachyistius frenatus]|uniref:T-cell-specific surface glycoprotein CD28 n=1 Tax=Brachyistius frenatus TaxID=100188 RepID=UPI0037E7193B
MRLVCWVLVILLGCGFSRGTPSSSNGTCAELLKIYRIPANGSMSVFVSCPNVTGRDVTFTLFKGKEELYKHCVGSDGKTSPDCQSQQPRPDIKPNKNKEDKFVGFILSGVADRTLDMYRCRVTITFPPPLQTEWSTRPILVVLEGQHCIEDDNIGHKVKTEDTTQRFPWIWVLVVAFLSTYSLTVTVIAFVSWLKLRETDSQSDYMNTKPRAPGDRRKKRGVLNPIPRYF